MRYVTGDSWVMTLRHRQTERQAGNFGTKQSVAAEAGGGFWKSCQAGHTHTGQGRQTYRRQTTHQRGREEHRDTSIVRLSRKRQEPIFKNKLKNLPKSE